MISRDIYKEAMEERLRNAEALIEASKAVGKDALKVHALMLSGLASEEIAKAYVCWLVVSKLIPRNHPLVQYQSKKSIFRSHDIKYEIITTMGATLLLAGFKKVKPGESFIPGRGEIFGMDIVAKHLAPESTRIRADRMYVDIRKNKSKKYKVLSPLKMNTDDFVLDYRFSTLMIEHIRYLYQLSSTDGFEHDIEKHRSNLRNIDPQYPDNPIW